MSAYRVVLADDHRMIRKGIRKIIEESPDIEVVGEAGDGLELLSLVQELLPDMVIADISMPNLSGIEAAREIKSLAPDTKILMLTMHKEKDLLSQAISAGAHGYILKEDADVELYSAIDRIRREGHYMSPTLSVNRSE